MIVGPVVTKTGNLALLRADVRLKLSRNVLVEVNISQLLAEEDKVGVFVKSELNVGVASLNVSEFCDKFLDEDTKGKLMSDSAAIFSGHKYRLNSLFLNLDLFLNLHNAWEFDYSLQLSQKLFNQLYLNLKHWGLDF